MSEKTSDSGTGNSSGKVTFFGKPAWAVIGGLALIAVLVVLVVNVIGRGVPSDAVATVDGQSIPVAEFNQTLKQSAQQLGGTIPDPPSFTKCIAAKKKASPKLSQESLKTACEKDWKDAKDGIMTQLVQQKWFELEAEDRGIEISDAEVKARFLQLKQQSFPKEADYKKFLKQYGQTETKILALVRANMYQEKVRQEVTTSPTPTTAQVTAEYNKNKKKYATPATRDLNVVFNPSKAKADAAKAELEAGGSWAAASKKYSKDDVSKQNGGKFPAVTKGQFPPELDKAVFSAKKGVIVGPIKTQYGYYVFEVTKATPGKQQTLAESAQQIRSLKQQADQQELQQKFQKEFTDKWRKKTRCADAFKVDAVCGNAPEPKEPKPGEGQGQQPPPGQ